MPYLRPYLQNKIESPRYYYISRSYLRVAFLTRVTLIVQCDKYCDNEQKSNVKVRFPSSALFPSSPSTVAAPYLSFPSPSVDIFSESTKGGRSRRYTPLWDRMTHFIENVNAKEAAERGKGNGDSAYRYEMSRASLASSKRSRYLM